MKSFLVLGMACLLLNSCKAQSKSKLIEDSYQSIVKEDFHYYLYFPEGYDSEADMDFPLLLFLHGGGESGGNLEEVKSNGPPKLIAEGNDFPFIILAPQNPHEKKWWNTHAIMALLDDIVANNRVDEKRIYLTGLSRGGGAAWELAVQYPEKFAALAVVCGMSPLPYAGWVDKEMPIWVFHGTEDKSISFSESEEMVKKLKSLGHDVKFTSYEGVGHNSWEKAYATEELYEWFVEQKRK